MSAGYTEVMDRQTILVLGILVGCEEASTSSIDAPRADGLHFPDTHDGLSCPTGYRALVDGSTQQPTTTKYRGIYGPLTWDEAAADCADDGPTTHLAVGTEHVTSQIVYADMLSTWWGQSDRLVEGTFKYVTDEPSTDPAVPSWNINSAEMDCVALARDAWFIISDCTATAHAVCECDVNPNNSANY
jgi:hypothetical protein